MHVENLGGAGDVSLGMLQTTGDVATFKLSSVLAKVGRERDAQTVAIVVFTFHNSALGNAGSHFVGQVAGTNFVTFGHDHGAVDRVLQLAHIPRPAVFEQLL